MHCPVCSGELTPGNHTCDCGSYYFHAWTGGGALLLGDETWTYDASTERWVQNERSSPPVKTLVQDKQQTAAPVAESTVQVSNTWTIPGQRFGR